MPQLKLKTKILILISIITLLTILRESGVLNFNLYSSNLTSNFSSNIKNSNLTFGTEKSSFNTTFKNGNFEDEAINIVGLNDKRVTENNNAFDIIINEVSIPISIIPLYTNIDYEVIALINDKVSISKTDAVNVYICDKTVNGTMTITGNLKAYGLLSNYEIRRIITADYKKNLKKMFRNNLVTNQ